VKDLIFTEAEVVDLWPVDLDPTEHARRSLYLFRKRNVRYPLFDAFDAPDTQNACPRRDTSTHALQALTLLNSDLAAGRARALTTRIMREGGESVDSRIQRAYKIVLAREAKPLEMERARSFLKAQAKRIPQEKSQAKALAGEVQACDQVDAVAWIDFSLALLNSNEFLYVP
jgi:Protein of unknown function (DUF1553)